MTRKNCKNCEMIELLRKGKNGDMIAVPKGCIDCSEIRHLTEIIECQAGEIDNYSHTVLSDLMKENVNLKQTIKKLLAENKDLRKALSQKR
jgi:hypothetical protein